jgi:hypothetical protein
MEMKKKLFAIFELLDEIGVREPTLAIFTSVEFLVGVA